MKLPHKLQLLEAGVNVVLVTAAGYGYHVEKYEARLTGLLAYLVQEGVSAEAMERFYVMGGEQPPPSSSVVAAYAPLSSSASSPDDL